ncbi:MAG: SPFH domain-containing protein [bacterium]|nr:SPFH domain-containing protein [bacterium]
MTDTTGATAPTSTLTGLVRTLKGLENVVRVDDTINTTFGRGAMLFGWVVLSTLSIPLGAWLVSFVSDSVLAWLLGGVLLWVPLLGLTIGHFLVYVREVTAFIGINAFTGVQHTFTTGLHVIWPWEQVHKRNFINLDMGAISESIQYNTKDGARFGYKYLILYRPSVERLPIYRSVNEGDIVVEVQAIARSALSIETMGRDASELSDAATATALERALQEKFGQHNDDVHELEHRFGITFVNVSLSEPTPNQDIIEGRQAIILAGMLRRAADTIRGKGKGRLSEQEAMNLAAMLNKEQVTKIVHAFEFGNDAPRVVAQIIAPFLARMGGQ